VVLQHRGREEEVRRTTNQIQGTQRSDSPRRGGFDGGRGGGEGLAQRARWRRRGGGRGVRPQPAGGTSPGVEAGEGREGLMCGVRATVSVNRVK
jgi:hypothetical protein